ncbi:MAG: hypothetical protein N4A62_02535 [Marinisporobacter sp.]|nr:hypothetical protein [Marinisporobacter sp.]
MIKSRKVEFRVTEKEYERIVKSSKKEGGSLSSYVRKRAIENEIIAIDSFNPMISDLKEKGKKLNAVIMLAHKGRIIEIDLSNIKAALNNILETLKIQNKN